MQSYTIASIDNKSFITSDLNNVQEEDTSLHITNTISIDTFWFDEDSNAIVVNWHIDLSVVPESLFYQYRYSLSLDSINDTTYQPDWDSIGLDTNTTMVPIGEDIVFDTSYTVGVWLRGYSDKGPGKPISPTDSSAVSVQIPFFTWQIVKLESDDTLGYFANGKVIFKKEEGFEIENRINTYKYPLAIPQGFIEIEALSFDFTEKNPQLPPITLGLIYGELPEGIDDEDIGLYRDSAGCLVVMHDFTIHDSAVWIELTMLDYVHPFIVLADTSVPVITVYSMNDTVRSGYRIPTRFIVSDNIANSYWKLMYGPGNEGYIYERFGYCNSIVDSLREYIDTSGGSVSESYGVRAIIIAYDGVNSDTVDISHRVITSTCGSLSLAGKNWTPLRAAASLDETSLDVIFDNSYLTSEPWEYDISKYRLFRWYSPDSTNTWLEYSDSVKEDFAFIPGRVIWCKSAENQSIIFGSGLTTSLTEPYQIVLKEKNWTDLSLPFKFPIMLRDILESTGPESDSIEVYYWRKEIDGTSYIAEEVYIGFFDNVEDVTDTIKSEQKHDAYTVYNHRDTTVILSIPPISLPLSICSDTTEGPIIKRTVKNSPDLWNISFLWRDKRKGEKTCYQRVRCGYEKQDKSEPFFGPMPPSFNTITAGVFDSISGKTAGYAIKHTLTDNGVTYDIIFSNNSGKTAEIEYFLENLEVTPEGYIAGIYNPEDEKYEFDVNNMRLENGNIEHRWVVIGTNDYLKNVITKLKPYSLIFLNVYPNPFNESIVLHYSTTSDIREVRFTMYDILGRTVWKGVRNNQYTGIHTLKLKGKNGSLNIPTGVYFMRMNTVNKSGKIKNIYEKKITCIK